MKRVIDLRGPDGNAFALLGYAKSFARQMELEWEPIHNEMTSGNYDNLVAVFKKHFGMIVEVIGLDDEESSEVE